MPYFGWGTVDLLTDSRCKAPDKRPGTYFCIIENRYEIVNDPCSRFSISSVTIKCNMLTVVVRNIQLPYRNDFLLWCCTVVSAQATLCKQLISSFSGSMSYSHKYRNIVQRFLTIISLLTHDKYTWDTFHVCHDRINLLKVFFNFSIILSSVFFFLYIYME